VSGKEVNYGKENRFIVGSKPLCFDSSFCRMREGGAGSTSSPPAPAAEAPAEPAAPSGEMKAPEEKPASETPMEKKDEETKTQ
jgi:hypothetical protein